MSIVECNEVTTSVVDSAATRSGAVDTFQRPVFSGSLKSLAVASQEGCSLALGISSGETDVWLFIYHVLCEF